MLRNHRIRAKYVNTQYVFLISQKDDIIKFLSDPDAPAEKPKPVEFGTYPGSDSVAILNNDNFENRINAEKKALVMFYAPCK